MRYQVSDLTHDSGSQGVLLLVCEPEEELVLEERVVTCESARSDYPDSARDEHFWLLNYYMMKVQADDRTGREGMPDMQGDEASQ